MRVLVQRFKAEDGTDLRCYLMLLDQSLPWPLSSYRNDKVWVMSCVLYSGGRLTVLSNNRYLSEFTADERFVENLGGLVSRGRWQLDGDPFTVERIISPTDASDEALVGWLTELMRWMPKVVVTV